MPVFSHLHCHTQFSLLDGAASIKDMIAKAKADNMPAVALTDHGNMFGAFEFVNTCNKEGVKAVVGCEFYVVEDRFQKSFTKGKKDKRYHQLMFAKNQEGYKNLSKLCSIGFIEGQYSKFPRIDKEVIKKHKTGLIATSCCIGAEIPQTIVRYGEEEGEKKLLEWLDIFEDDFFLELQRHNIMDIDIDGAASGWSQEDVNQVLLKWGEKYKIPVIATNDSHYVEENDWYPHDILLCVNTGEKIHTPKGHGKGKRFGFPNEQFYFKSQAEMNELFKDVPFAIDNTNLLIERITPPQIKRDILLPAYNLPDGFKTQNDYLRHITFEGAKRKYGEVTAEISERLDYELKIIEGMGFPGYFLIVQDFTTVARELGVSVGPGRGSAAGSAVAYATGITNIDPIKYKLLFERFLNPERVTMPDIDIDFDDEGRGKIIDYVVKKYGENQVAQIITYGTMAAKSSIRDVGRVLDLPLPETDRIAKLVPDISLKKVFGLDDAGLKEKLNSDQIAQVHELRKIAKGDDLAGKTLQAAQRLEGSVRNTGVHACGVIITPDDIREYIPVCTSKDSDLLLTQFDNKLVEDAGLLKMDFLGLKTLTIIKDAIENIKLRHNIEIDPDEIPLDDLATYELFQRGETIGIFQFESAGMQKYMRELLPTNIEDIIAMNALYRPGPMEYIPLFVDRKHGRKPVEFPHELLSEILSDTYGIMVYQEQIMQTAQIIGGFTLGGADILRRAMGKKKMDVMAQQKEIFVKGAKELHSISEKKSAEIFDMMAEFAKYGFNRSHAAAYSLLAYQTAYLKAHYPAEFMASVLTHNMSDITKLNFFLNECNRMGIKALVPDINESYVKFTVNQQGEIRFGMAAVKGVGSAIVQEVINERNKNGHFKSVFDLTKRVESKSMNKRLLENLVKAGGFDSIGMPRSMYIEPDENDGQTGVEKALKFGKSYQSQQSSNQASLFGAVGIDDIQEPKISEREEWTLIDKLNLEREVTGIFLSSHPLDEYKLEIESFCNCTLPEIEKFKNKGVNLGVIVQTHQSRTTKTGKPFGIIKLEDKDGSYELALFGEDYLKFKYFFEPGQALYLKATYQARKWNKDEFELKVNQISLMSEVRSTTRKIIIKMSLVELKDYNINELINIIKCHPGKIGLRIEVEDAENKIAFYSSKYMVEIHDNFIEEFNALKIGKIEFSQ